MPGQVDFIELDRPPIEAVPLVKQSHQITSNKTSAAFENTWPRPWDPNDLLGTLTISTYHARAIAFKAVATVGLGFNIGPIKNRSLEPDDPDKFYSEDEARKKYPFMYKTNDRDESVTEVLVRSQMDKETIGDGWVEPTRTRGGDIDTLCWLPGETAYIAKGKKDDKDQFGRIKPVVGYVQKIQSAYRHFRKFGAEIEEKKPGELIRFKNPMLGNYWYGIPDYLPAIRAMALKRAADDFNYAFFANGAIPGWAFTASGTKLDAKLRKKLSEFFNSQFGGADKANKLLILTFDNPDVQAEFQRITAKVEEMSFEKLFGTTTTEIISAHGTPPRLLGIISPGQLGGGSEFQQQLKTFKEVLIRPKQVLVEETLANTLFFETGDYIDFNEIDISPVAPQPATDTESVFATGEVSDGDGKATAEGLAIMNKLIAARNELLKSDSLDNLEDILTGHE